MEAYLITEMVLSYNVTTLSNETLVLVWISSDDVAAVAQKGFKLIHAASDYFYLVSQISSSPVIKLISFAV
jgi:N-acetyl-beta-hexosaminidase